MTRTRLHVVLGLEGPSCSSPCAQEPRGEGPRRRGDRDVVVCQLGGQQLDGRLISAHFGSSRAITGHVGSSSTAAERSEIRRTAGAAAAAVRAVKPKAWKRLTSPSDALKALAWGHAGHALL